MPLKSIALLLASAAAVAGACAAESEKEDKEIAAMLAAFPKWSASTSLDVAYGYRDNLLLSAFDEEGSAFARGVAELMLLRVPTGKLEYSFFIQGERTHFLRGETVENEASAWAQSELGWRFLDSLRVGLPIIGHYTDRVFDVSNSSVEEERGIAELSVRGAILAPVLKWNFLPSWWVEAQASGERKRYRDGSNDSVVGEGDVRLGWIRGERLEVRLTGTRRWREYEHRLLKSAVGRDRPDTVLRISEQEVQARVDVGWDKANRWRTNTSVSLLHYRDSGVGYYNYREQRVEHELEWTGERWLIGVRGAASRQDFAVRTVDATDGGERPLRVRDEYSASLSVERTLSPHWTALGSYRWERSRSNDFYAGYRVNEGLLGLRWSWDK
ncbi:MAG TPA: hypothetical protein VGE76_12545 [Opitutaceae bacterium]